MGKVIAFEESLIKTKKKIAVYGTTRCGRLTKRALEILGGGVDIFIDRIKDNELFYGVPVLHYEEIEDVNQYLIINCTSSNFWNVSEFLFEHGVEKVYHSLLLLKLVPKDDGVLEMGDTRKLYESYIKKEENDSIYKLSVIITEKCSLNCKYCTEYMPYISDVAKHGDISICQKAILKLLEAIGKIESLTIIGGEVFTHPHWDRIVVWAIEEKRIEKVKILTNSTIIPAYKEILKNERVQLVLDDYGNKSRKLRDLIEWAENENIDYTVFRHDRWFNVFESDYISETESELSNKYNLCHLKGCWNISDGYLYKCTTSYYKMKYMLSKEIGIKTDFIDLINLDISQIKELIFKISNKKYLEACKYCVGTSSDNIVGIAEQI